MELLLLLFPQEIILKQNQSYERLCNGKFAQKFTEIAKATDLKNAGSHECDSSDNYLPAVMKFWSN